MSVKNDVIRLCAWCRRVWSDGRWAELPIPQQVDIHGITHGICKDCANKEMECLHNDHSDTPLHK
jgi:hypothetical protein